MQGQVFSGIKRDSVVERDGILVDHLIAEKTVWDKLAKENPTHAVISAGDERAAEVKSREQIAELERELKDGIVLDLGCGYGRIAQYLLPKRSFEGYIGIDSAYSMLAIFRARYAGSEAEQRTPLTLINADIHTIPLKEASVDNVVVAAVFLHNHKSVVQQSIEEIKRALKPGGKVFVYSSFPNKVSFMGLQGMAYQMLLNLSGNPFKNGPVRYYSRQEVADLFSDFSEVTIKPYGFAVFPKRLIFLPSSIDALYRNIIAEPMNRLLSKVLSNRYFPSHFDIAAANLHEQ